MNAIVTQDVTIPSPEEFGIVWETFYLVIAVIATYRANENGPKRFGELAMYASDLLSEAANSDEMNTIIENMINDDKEKIPLGILYEEMQYISWKYQGVFEHVGMDIPEAIYDMGELFPDEIGEPLDASTIKDIKNVVGSVNKLLDRLPNWMRKGVDVILEALQLTRGAV